MIPPSDLHSTPYLTHFFGGGLIDKGECYVVERFRSMSSGEIRRSPGKASSGKNGRGRGHPEIASVDEVRELRPCTTRSLFAQDSGPGQACSTSVPMPSGVRFCGDSASPGRRPTRSLAAAGRPSDVVHPPLQETPPVPYRDPHKRRANDPKRHRRRTAQGMARGLCPRCGKRQPQPGRSQCAVCLEKRRAADRIRARQRKAAGIGRVRD